MATISQIDANRANAQLSTGPKTEEGKQASSANATKTGLTSGKIFVRDEEAGEFDTFSDNLLAEFLPNGEFQNHLFDLILHAAWNLRRCMLLEGEIQNEAIARGLPDALLSDELSRKLDRIYRYKKMHESTQRKSIAELRKLQSEQTWRGETAFQAEESILTDMPAVVMKCYRAASLKAKYDPAAFQSMLESMAPPKPSAQNEPKSPYPVAG